MTDELAPDERAQRWHDTDHGNTPPDGVDWVSGCWCCCELCDPGYKPPRPNPFWREAWAWLEVEK